MVTLAVVLAACVPVPLDAAVSPTPQAVDLRAVYASDGVWVAEQSGDRFAPVQMSLRSWGREGALEHAEAVVPRKATASPVAPRRMDYVRRGLVEWWEERADGLEQGFTVESPTQGAGFLVFDLVVDGANVIVAEGRATAATFSSTCADGSTTTTSTNSGEASTALDRVPSRHTHHPNVRRDSPRATANALRDSPDAIHSATNARHSASLRLLSAGIRNRAWVGEDRGLRPIGGPRSTTPSSSRARPGRGRPTSAARSRSSRAGSGCARCTAA